jgi:uncharacterized protein YidB (DUF937 family)
MNLTSYGPAQERRIRMPPLDSLLEKHGGDLKQLVGRFESSGFGNKVKSWIGTGDNEALSADEVKQALGPEQVNDLAREAGVEPDEAADALARDLPEAVDRSTPGGIIPSMDEVRDKFSKLIRR